MQAPVFVSVVEVGADAITDHHPQLFVEGQVASVEDAVNVTP
jgi:hypothetical protein